MTVMALALSLLLAPLARAGTARDLMKEYQKAGAAEFSAARGETMWSAIHTGKDGPMSCAACHTANLKNQGKHAVTGKVIEPMAPSANPQRLTDVKFIEKWFKRNCKETLDRECTPREKGDFLAFISGK
ncbi:MAG: DUF1924 domain-containing protein [Nitrospinae bacterium]|nr:DUF1924 domain-containing protein [Nitrospinota bacterium]